MKKILLIFAFSSILTLLFFSNSRADDNATQEYECCCVLTCEWEYMVLNPICLLDPFSANLRGTVYTTYNECTSMQPDQESTCESPQYADTRCKTTKRDVWDIVNQNKDKICSAAQLPLFGDSNCLGSDILCAFGPVGCSSAYLLGYDNPGLDVLKQFRDEVLSTSETGRKLIGLYYEYSDILTEVFDKNPALKARATNLLEKVIPLAKAILENDGGGMLFTNEFISEAVDLLDGIDAVMTSPLKERLLEMRNDLIGS